MGTAYAERLSEKGFTLLLYSRRPHAARELATRLGARVASESDLLEPDTIVVNAGWDDEYLISLANLVRQGHSILVNTATVSPAASLKAGRIVGESRYLEAPVAGGPGVAREGKLPIIIAYWDKAVYDKARLVIEALASTVIHAGEPPRAMVVKLAFNNLLFTAIAGFASSMRLDASWGIDLDVFKRLLESTWLRVIVERYWERALTERPASFRLAGAIKDLYLALGAHAEKGSPASSTMGALNEYLEAMRVCGGDVDYTNVVRCNLEKPGEKS